MATPCVLLFMVVVCDEILITQDVAQLSTVFYCIYKQPQAAIGLPYRPPSSSNPGGRQTDPKTYSVCRNTHPAASHSFVE